MSEKFPDRPFTTDIRGFRRFLEANPLAVTWSRRFLRGWHWNGFSRDVGSLSRADWIRAYYEEFKPGDRFLFTPSENGLTITATRGAEELDCFDVLLPVGAAPASGEDRPPMDSKEFGDMVEHCGGAAGHRIKGICLYGEDVVHFSFEGTLAVNCRFVNCDFVDCDFNWAEFKGCSLERSNLRGACLTGTLLDGGAAGAVFRRTEFTAATLRLKAHGADFAGCRFENCLLEDCDFEHADFEHAVFYGCTIRRCRFPKGWKAPSLFADCLLEDCNVEDGNFVKTAFKTCRFKACRLPDGWNAQGRFEGCAVEPCEPEPAVLP